MPRALPISGDYSPDWPEINARVCAEAGHRCIRCHHPYKKGTHGAGEWTPCDAQCRHGGPVATLFRDGSLGRPFDPENAGDFLTAERKKGSPFFLSAQWRILTVHHFDGNKANNAWWNLLPLCQRCHLTIQARVNPQQPYMFEHSEWLRPYVAGFYAKKYEGLDLTREEVIARLDQLLAHERIA